MGPPAKAIFLSDEDAKIILKSLNKRTEILHKLIESGELRGQPLEEARTALRQLDDLHFRMRAFRKPSLLDSR